MRISEPEAATEIVAGTRVTINRLKGGQADTRSGCGR